MLFFGSQINLDQPTFSYPYINFGTINQWFIDITYPIVVNISNKSIGIGLYILFFDISKLLDANPNKIVNDVIIYNKKLLKNLTNFHSYNVT
jgi:hypothetical protein